MVKDMTSCFREYNLYLTTAQMYQEKIGEFYKRMEVECEVEGFSECVECSIRYMQYFGNLVFTQAIFKYVCRNMMEAVSMELVEVAQSEASTQSEKLVALRELSVVLQYKIMSNREETLKQIRERKEWGDYV